MGTLGDFLFRGRQRCIPVLLTGIGTQCYDAALFTQVMRTGFVKARRLNQIMPWHIYRGMTRFGRRICLPQDAQARAAPRGQHGAADVLQGLPPNPWGWKPELGAAITCQRCFAGFRSSGRQPFPYPITEELPVKGQPSRGSQNSATLVGVSQRATLRLQL